MLENLLEESGIGTDRESVVNRNGAFEYMNLESADIMFWKHGIPSVRIAGGHAGEILSIVADVLERNDI